MTSILNVFACVLSRYKKNKMKHRLLKRNVILNDPFYVSDFSKLKVYSNVYIGTGAWLSLFGTLSIGDGTIVGPRLKVHTGNHNYESDMLPYNGDVLVKKVTIEQFVWIGADVTILPGVTIGEGAIVGACSVVTKDVLPYAVVAGNPARIIKYRDKERYVANKKANKSYIESKAKGEIDVKIINLS